ncbi:Tachykinin-like peptides receptor 99D [Bulinus truncatus]|nr:Tachykinin-like peptides receptor 99D [Bulinus truncatus]
MCTPESLLTNSCFVSNTSMVNLSSDVNLTSAKNGSGDESDSYVLPWWQQTIFYTMFIFMFIIAAGGNVIVVWIVLAHKRMRTVTNYFLVNLAIADVLISIFNVLFHFTFNMYQNWFFGLEYCKFALFIAQCTISVSVLTFMAIAIDRLNNTITIYRKQAGHTGVGLIVWICVSHRKLLVCKFRKWGQDWKSCFRLPLGEHFRCAETFGHFWEGRDMKYLCRISDRTGHMTQAFRIVRNRPGTRTSALKPTDYVYQASID